MVIAQLNKNGLEPDDSRIAMIKAREAYTRVPWQRQGWHSVVKSTRQETR